MGLAGYYRKFIKNFGIISKPLIELLKKYSFGRNEMAQETFERLKGALCIAHVLALLDFRKVFVLETNACTNGLGVVLGQEGRPLAFFNKALGTKHLGLSIYKKEYIAILIAVDRWRHYLEHNQCVIKTNHESLRYLLEQKMHTLLLELNYQIQ